MSTPIDQCRYCGREGGDEFTGGPDDIAPGVCPICINARMAVLMFAAAQRVEDDLDGTKAWLRAEMLDLGITPTWADRFIDADIASFASARERLSR
jgi:hypothetical protein